MPSQNSSRSSWKIAASALIILILAVGLRLLACFNDFSMDEIMSLSLALRLKSPWEIISQANVGNNHLLNTFFMYLLGDQANWVIYRLPAVLAGSLTVVLAGLIGKLRGKLEALLAMLLTGCSSLMIQFSSEARGYAFMLLAALLAFYALWRFMKEKKPIMAWLFSVSSILGFVSHLTFAFFYGAAAVWSGTRFILERQNWREALRNLAYCQALPTLFFLFLYLVKIRHIAFEGGEKFPVYKLWVYSLALTLGAPPRGLLAMIAALIIIAGFLGGLSLLRRENPPLDYFFIDLFLLNTFVLYMMTYYSDIRFILITLEFILILLAFFLAHLYREGNLGKFFATLFIIFFIIGNAWHFSKLLIYGRGQYLKAMSFMSNNTQSDNLTIGSDHDFRNKLILAYYARRLPDNLNITYYNYDPGRGFSNADQDYVMTYISPFLGGKSDNFDYRSWPPQGPEWYIVHRLWLETGQPAPAQTLQDYLGHHYILAGIFKCGGITGFSWYIYHNQNRERPH